MSIVVRKYSAVIIINNNNNNNIASMYLWLYFHFFSWWTIKHLLDSAGSNIFKIYSVSLKHIQLGLRPRRIFVARLNKS